MENQCNVCENNKFYFTKKNKVIDINSTNWEHQSTVELANITDKFFYFGLCKACFNAKLFPEFDTNLIYKDKTGYEVRKKYFEKYFPKKKYYNLDDIPISKKKLMLKSESKRIQSIAIDFANLITKNFNDKNQIDILDFGGADAYLSNILSNLLKIQTNKKISIKNYDPQFQNDFEKGKNQDKYDFVIISHVLEHVHNLRELFFNLNNLIHEDTIIFFEVPDERYSLIKKFLSLEKVYLHYHVNIFSSYGIRKLFKSNGFNTQHSYKLSSYRGNTLTVISGFAGKNIEDKKKDLFYEIFSLFKFSIHKIISKVKNR